MTLVYNPNGYNKAELQHIIAHEKVHVKQYHSIDILISQLAIVVFWFNPITWFYKKDLQQNLEFIADFKAQNSTSCKKSYQHLLLKTSVPNQHIAITNNFYNSLIKKRIVMLHKSKSKKINLLKYTFVLPFLALFLMGFNTEEVYVEKVSEKIIPNTVQYRLETQKTNKPDSLKIIFNKDLSDKDLKKIEKKLKRNNIKFTYSNLKRNKKGEISNIATKFEIDKGGYCTYNAVNSPIRAFYFKKNNDKFGVGAIKKEVKTDKLQVEESIKLKLKNIKPFNATITKDFTDADFENAIEKGKEKGVILKFSKIKRNSKNEIIAIHAEFKNEHGAGSISFNSTNPIKPFAYTQSKSNFGFGKPIANVKVIGYVNPKFYQGGKTISADSVIFNKSNKTGYTYKIKTDTISKNPWKVTVGVNADSLKTSEWTTVTGRPTFKTINYSNLLKTNNGEKPLIILDGEEISNNYINIIDPNKIQSVSVLKDESIKSKYGEKAKNGVVILTTKTNDNLHDKIKVVGYAVNSNKNQLDKPLLIVDGKEEKDKTIKDFDTNKIESVSVLKGEKAIDKYGDKAKNGVVIITSKDNKNAKWKTEFKIGKPMNSNNEQEEFIISGKVTHDFGPEIQGAMVVIEEKQRGVSTNAKGEYKIKVAKGDKIIFSHKSLVSQEKTVNDKSEINIKLSSKNGFAIDGMNPKKPIYYIYGKEVSKKEYNKKFQNMLKKAKKEHDNKNKDNEDKEVTPVVSGIITDKKGKPIQGAMILNGETTAVMTNAKGEYRIKAVEGDKLTYSFKDMASQEIEVKENKTIDVKLIKKKN